ncbi:Sec-independent protein translocase TatB [Xylanimonas oleitrophica]|uniref:Sec-independent protein translocase TatB n=1 Tax=Xylanimonas oleitrophica TaxID=2607479 RepID=A0A2W5Y945_9MICO|nr:twin-arginine translocase TatA/TatE family subunit [Xylanimonas oleitrophica]PZR55094.1 Sec-independent protein translocase TatB [Xylanimonas oleitrophica]
MFDINGGELLIIAVLAVVLIGPERLPEYASQLASLVRRGRAFVQDARTRVGDELGGELDDVDWSKLDPRQYDPRRIVREALLEDGPLLPGPGERGAARSAAAGTAGAAAAGAAAGAVRTRAPEEPAPFDDEAT